MPRGRPPNPDSPEVMIRFSDTGIKRALSGISDQYEVSISEIVQRVLDDLLERDVLEKEFARAYLARFNQRAAKVAQPT